MAFTSRVEKWLDAVAASNLGNSDWQSIPHEDDVTIHIFGLATGDQVTVEGSNEDSPANPVTLATVADSDDIVRLDEGIRKVRVNVTADGGNASSVTAIAHFRREP